MNLFVSVLNPLSVELIIKGTNTAYAEKFFVEILEVKDEKKR